MKRNVKLLGTMAMLSMALASCTTDELKEVYFKTLEREENCSSIPDYDECQALNG